LTLPTREAATIRALAILVAFCVDHFIGEPPSRLHPVVWMGKALSSTGAPWTQAAPRIAFAYGAAVWMIGAALTGAVAWAVVMLIQRGIGAVSIGDQLAQAALLGLLLKPLLSWRMLSREVAAVECAVENGIETGRMQLRRLVSRDTTRLSTIEVRESALESLAENLNDSLVAPLLWFAIGGVPAAALYRFANTADAMWGYRGCWEWAGKWAARADDLLSYVPARLTAAILALSAWRSPSQLRRIARVTPSPNGGWPMGMLALALNVRLSKPGVYVLNAAGSIVEEGHVWAGLRVCERAAWLTVALSAATTLVVGRWS
jgi:adenosylcobinamide-phosphate synthase